MYGIMDIDYYALYSKDITDAVSISINTLMFVFDFLWETFSMIFQFLHGCKL